jgi:hypothetical protein
MFPEKKYIEPLCCNPQSAMGGCHYVSILEIAIESNSPLYYLMYNSMPQKVMMYKLVKRFGIRLIVGILKSIFRAT